MTAPLHGQDLKGRSGNGETLTIEASFLSELLLGLIVTASIRRIYFD